MSAPSSPAQIGRKTALTSSTGSSTSAAPNSPLQPSRNASLNAIGSQSTPTPRSSMNMNDDKAEKAARRKSAHFGDIGVEAAKERLAGQKRTVSASASGSSGSGLNASTGPGARKGKRLSAVAPAALVESIEAMTSNFDEAMKVITDNKITANNTWNFALIDYFADMTLLRNVEDQSINFQKASCTLDGCVKIWTSRVDSVATETGKLLSGLAGGGVAGDDEEGVDGEDDEEGGETRKARKTNRSEATLAKSFATLQVKKFDLEFSVDPLFKKTCADFDEGGAMGLLMNHLGVDGKGRVVFDAGDAGAEEDEDEDVELPPDDMIHLTEIRKYIPPLEKTLELNISDTLQSFRFSSDPNSMPDFATLLGLKDTYNDEAGDLGEEFAPTGTGEAHDFFGDDDDDMGGGGGGYDYDDAGSAGGYEDQGEGYGGGGLGMAGPGGDHLPFDPRRQGGSELVMALVGGESEEGMFEYFDKGFGKSWAGGEHWKLRKVTRKDPAATAAPRTAKVAKAPFTIDFSSPATAATSSKVMFAPATKSSISLPSSSRTSTSRKSGKRGSELDSKKRKEEWLLPDDMHFSSRQLLRLFLKPKFALRMRRNAQAARMTEDANGEIDENFWAQAAADRVDFDDAGGDDNGGAPIPFESQFFHDDVDDGYVDDALDVDEGAMPSLGDGEEDDLLQGTQGQELKKAKPENVHFAKKAKRVDVKRLKDDIWTGLKVLVPEKRAAPDSASEEPETSAPAPSEPEPTKTFDTVIQDLRGSYPREKMSEISTSFCFICLLHLCNEEGLQIETARYDGLEGEDVGCMGEVDLADLEADDLTAKWRKGNKRARLDDGDRRDRIVGELQALRVKKDPNVQKITAVTAE